MDVVRVDRVCKDFRRSTSGKPRTLRGLVEGDRWDRVRALSDVSFTVAKGESVALMGGNGSGKSTLLRIIAGVTKATAGKVHVRGATSALLSLGHGLDTMLTGEENAYSGAVLAGIPRKEAHRRLAEIAKFAELEDVFDQPMRTYSDGMRMRLAFATAINIDPDILLLDEVLAVGDMRFQLRCLRRLQELREQGVTCLLVSHQANQVRSLATRAVWLSNGVVQLMGPADVVADAYEQRSLALPNEAPIMTGGLYRVGSREKIEVTGIELLDASGQATSRIHAGSGVDIRVAYRAKSAAASVTASISVHRGSDGSRPIDLSTERDGIELGTLAGDGHIQLHLDRLDLSGGIYYLDVGLYSADWSTTHDFLWEAYEFEVVGAQTEAPIAPPRTWNVE